MAISYLSPINLNQQEIQNVRLQNLATDPSSPVEGQLFENTASHRSKIYDGSVIQVFAYLTDRLDQFAPPTSAVSFNNQSITNVATPVNPLDAANKQYVDQTELGLDVKASVVAATVVAGTLATSFANGSVIDGITLATGNRILIKNQTTASENGIYVVASTGAPTRSADCNSSTNYLTGAFTFVETGTVNQGSSWVVSTQGTITPGTTSVSWSQFSGTATTAVNLVGGVLGSVPYQSAASTTAMLAGNTTNTDQVLVSHGTGTTAAAPTFTNAPSLSAANMTNFPTFNQNTTGNAATATVAANVAGGVLGSIDYQSGSNTTTQLAPNTAAVDAVLVSHGTGSVGTAPIFSNAPALSATNFPVASFPTLNQSTTGNAATATLAASATNIAGGTAGAIDYQSAAGTTAFVAGNTTATDQVLVSHGTGTAASAPTLSNAPALSAANMTSFPTLNQNTTGTAANVTGVVAIANGGTGSATVAGAKTNLGFMTRYTTAVGDGVSTSIVITHNLGTQAVHTSLYLSVSPFSLVYVDTQFTSTTTLTLTFSTAPTSGQYQLVVIG